MSEPEAIDKEWIEKVRRREEEAARLLVERLYPLVSRIVRAHRPRQMDEEDLCQEVFMSLFENLGQYRGAAPFEHWVSRVAVHTCIDHLRRHRSRPELRWADLTEAESEALRAMAADEAEPSIEHAAGNRELVGKLLETLDPKDRLLMQWLEIEDHSVQEVAARTGWSKTLVKVRAFRARGRMRKAFKGILDQEPL